MIYYKMKKNTLITIIIFLFLFIYLLRLYHVYNNILVYIFGSINRNPIMNITLSLSYDKLEYISKKKNIKMHIIISFILLKLIQKNPNLNRMVSPITNRIVNINGLSIQVYDNKSKKMVNVKINDNDMTSINTYANKFNKIINEVRDCSQKSCNKYNSKLIIESMVLSLPTFIKEKICFLGQPGNSLYYAFLSDTNNVNKNSVVEEVTAHVPYWVGPQNGMQSVVTPIGTLNKLNIGISIDHRIITGYDTKLLARDINEIYESLML